MAGTMRLLLLHLLVCTSTALQLLLPTSPVTRRLPTTTMLAKKGGAKSSNVQVLLSADIKGVGKKGELVSVKPAYAQNFITAQGLGAIATKEVLADLQRQDEEAAEAAAAALEEAAAAKIKLEEKFGLSTDGIVVKKKAGPSGEIFGKVTNGDVSRLIGERTGTEVDKRHISVPAIKGLGSAVAKVSLHKEVEATVKLVVIQE